MCLTVSVNEININRNKLLLAIKNVIIVDFACSIMFSILYYFAQFNNELIIAKRYN